MAQKWPKITQNSPKWLKLAQKWPQMAQKLAPAEKYSTDISAASAAFCISAGGLPGAHLLTLLWTQNLEMLEIKKQKNVFLS